MSDVISQYPVMILEDRYCGTYSGGMWIAIAEADKAGRYEMVYDGAHGDDSDACAFWTDALEYEWIAVGDSPEEALRKLRELAE